MQVTSKSPVSLELKREGGCILTARVDYWRAAPSGWELADSSLFQQVTRPTEVQEIRLAPGIYTAVVSCRAEESINGVYAVELAVNHVLVAHKDGDVDTTASPHDSAAFKNQFMLNVLAAS